MNLFCMITPFVGEHLYRYAIENAAVKRFACTSRMRGSQALATVVLDVA